MGRKNKCEVRWSLPAIGDLLDIRNHLLADTHSRNLAESSVFRIHAAGENLSDHPHLWRERNEIASNLRLAPVHPYFICYRISPNCVEIVRVVHEKRDIIAMFAEIENRI